MKPLPRRELIRLSRRSFIRGSTALITSSLLLPRKSRAWTHGGGGGGGGYVAKAVHFNGVSAYLQRGASLTGLVPSKKCFFAAWLKSINPADGSYLGAIYDGLDNGVFQILGGNTEGNPGISLELNLVNNIGNPGGPQWGNATIANTDTWHLYAGTADMNGSASFQFILDDASSIITGGTFIPDDISFPGTDCFIGQEGFGDFNAFDVADLRFWSGIAPDLSVTANRRALIDAQGKPVDPAVSTAAFGQPIILFSGDKDTFSGNQGTGGPFTLTGTLTNASTSPSD